MKKFILPSLALAFAVGFSAFTAPTSHNKSTTEYFYTYSSSLQTVAARETLTNYVLSSNPTTDPLCTGSKTCSVAVDFTTGSETTDLSTFAFNFDVNGFITSQISGPGTFKKEEKKP
jgi:hypothetical protein